jgi:hypothetical protein
MILDNSTKTQRHRELANALSQMSNILWAIQHRQHSWDERIKAMQQINKAIPDVIRYMLYFKNTETKV